MASRSFNSLREFFHDRRIFPKSSVNRFAVLDQAWICNTGQERRPIARVNHALHSLEIYTWKNAAECSLHRESRGTTKEGGREGGGKGEGLRLCIYTASMRQEQRQIYRGISEELSRAARVAALLPRGHAKYARSLFDNLIPPRR